MTKAGTKQLEHLSDGVGQAQKSITVPAKGIFSSLKSGFGAFFAELKNGESASKALAGQIKGLLSPVGALATGLTILGALAMTCWNKMTLSAEAYAAKLSKATEKAREKREETEKRIQATRKCIAQ